MTTRKIQVPVGFDQTLLDWLDTEVRRRGVSRAQLIRDLVLREMNAPTEPKVSR